MSVFCWDFDGTLAYSVHLWSSSVFRALNETVADHNVMFQDIRRCNASGFTWHTPEQDFSVFVGEKWWEFMNAHFFRSFVSLGISESDAKSASEKVRDIIMQPSNYNLFDDTVYVLEKAKEKGHANIILSNNYPELETIYDTIKPLEPEKLMRIKGLSSARADIFPAALAVIEAIKARTNFNEIVIGGAGMREGAMLRYAYPTIAEKPISDILGHSIYTLLHHFNMNIQHAEHVFDLSMQLFKQVKVIHKLPRPYVKILRVASMLHDIGSSMKFYDHHKHSMYMILNSNLYGIPQKDLIMAAMVAGLHYKDGLEQLDVQKYLDLLTEEEIIAVRKLGVIVRIAECFDRSCGGAIVGISCDVLGDSVILKTKAQGDCTLEIKDALTALGDFKRAFKKNLEIL